MFSEKLTGLKPERIACKKKAVNPTGQSDLLETNNGRVVIVREMSKHTGMKWQEELERRKTAIEIHRSELPEYTPECQLVVLQEENGCPVLGRMMENFSNCRSLDKLGWEEIGVEVCEVAAKVSTWKLKQLLERNRLFDPGVVRKNPLASTQIMVGLNKNINPIIFVDPDWFCEYGERGMENLIKKGVYATVLLSRAIFWNLMLLSKKYAPQLEMRSVEKRT